MKCSRITWLFLIAILLFITTIFVSCIHKQKHFIRADGNIYINNILSDIKFTHKEIESIVSDVLKKHKEKLSGAEIDILHPYDNAVFPKDMASPVFSWKSPDIDPKIWIIKIELPASSPTLFILSNQTSWVPDKEIWTLIKKSSANISATLTIIGYSYKLKGIITSREIHFSTSVDSVVAPIVYQQMMIPIEVGSQFPNTSKWLIGDVSSYQQPDIILENQNVCGMCHHFSLDGKVFGLDLDIDGDKGAYGIGPVKKQITLKKKNFLSWTEFQNDSNITLGLFSKISPTGQYVISTIKEKRVFIQINDLDFSELFFPYEGIFACYNRKSDKFFYLPGADNPEFVHVGADWSPDEKHIVFSRAKAKKEFDKAMKGNAFLKAGRFERISDLQKKYKIQYDLYHIPFNNGQGGLAKPLNGASNNGKSNYWPRYSPDGKWIVFTQSDNAIMNQPNSELYIIPAKGGKARRMNCSRRIHNSWHSWSPNSRWLTFSSKVNTPFTEIFIAHVDEDGNDSQPVLLTRFNSKQLASVMPEFANIKPDELKKIIIK